MVVMREDIDFVITWVDSNDTNWIDQKKLYSGKDTDSGNSRYRDWELLKYWFRGVEEFAPWVRKIHFVTWGHLPKWLDTNHPKINIVQHHDFIPDHYLPTFSSRSIDLNLHRIEGVAEKFVYFNDDMFILNKVKKKDFFKNGLPCETAILNVTTPIKPKEVEGFSKSFTAPFFNMMLINSHFSKNKSIRKNFLKWINIKYGIKGLRTLLLLPWNKFPSLMNFHLPYSYLKSTYEEVWYKEPHILSKACENKFRKYTDVNHWVMNYWQIASGNFSSRSTRIGEYYILKPSDILNNNIYKSISKQKYKLICINDSYEIQDGELIK